MRSFIWHTVLIDLIKWAFYIFILHIWPPICQVVSTPLLVCVIITFRFAIQDKDLDFDFTLYIYILSFSYSIEIC